MYVCENLSLTIHGSFGFRASLSVICFMGHTK